MFSPETPHGKKLLTTALLKRAVSDIQRARQIHEEKPPLQNLVKQGVVGDDLWEQLTAAEKELDMEVQEVVEEADIYQEGWGPKIFQEAGQIAQVQAQQAQLAAQRAAMEQAQTQLGARNENDELEGHDHSHPHSHDGQQHPPQKATNKSPTLSTSSSATSVIPDGPPRETDEERRQRLERELLEWEDAEKRRKGKAASKTAAKAGKGGKKKGK
ncbi:translocation protein S66 [Rhizophlyctis rosea]|uniref:Translocation protein S66 n=1 Tax=Rhizophlyctis rosea TaxID=64517 RepID=A0AAD5SKX9_9FUNG|nr:translocation protein S66 [Rhizophlyctis rosea]